MSLVRRLARPALATIFVMGGIDALRHPGPRTQLAAPFVERVSSLTGMPNDPELMVRANGATMALAGIALASGWMPRPAGLLLAGTLIPTTYSGHAFWNETDPTARKQQLLHFQKNLGLFGGALLASVDTEGKPGLAWRARHAANVARREARRNAKAARREAKLAAAQAKVKVA